MAGLDDNAGVTAGGAVNITADSANNLSPTASGNAYGLVEGGSSIAGRTNGQVYYVRYINPTTIALAPTLAAATAQPVNFAAANGSNNSITFSAADGLTIGEAVTYQANGSPIAGLTDGDIYYDADRHQHRRRGQPRQHRQQLRRRQRHPE